MTSGVPGASPPSVPIGLHSTGTSSTSVSLAWSASTDDVGVAGYRIYRDGIKIGAPAGTSFTDSGLAPGTTYSYCVRAVDAVPLFSASFLGLRT